MLDRGIDGGGKPEQGEDVVLRGRERGEMAQGEVRGPPCSGRGRPEGRLAPIAAGVVDRQRLWLPDQIS